MSPVRNSYILNKISRRFLAGTAVYVFSSQAFTFLTPLIAGNFLGEKSIAATTLMLPLEEFQYALIYLLAAGASYLAAELFGSNRHNEVSKHFTVSLLSVTIVMAALSVAVFLSKDLLTVFLSDGNPELEPLLEKFLKTICLSFLPAGLFFTLGYFVLAEGHSGFSAICNIVAFVTNIIFCILFLSFTDLGIASLPFSSIIGSMVGIAMILPFITKKTSLKPVKLHGEFRAILLANVKKGLPLMASDLIFISFIAAVNYIVLRSAGVSGSVIWGVVCSLVYFSDCITSSLVESSNTLGEQLYGAKDYKGQKQIIGRYDKLACFSLFVILLTVELCPVFVLQCFNIPGEVASTMKNSFRLAAPLLAVELVAAYEFSILYFLQHSRKYLISVTLQYLGIISILFLAGTMDRNCLWWSFTLVTAADLLVAAVIKKKLDDELTELSGNLLFYETSLPYGYGSIGPVLMSVRSFLTESKVSDEDMNAVEHCVDELCYNIIKHVPEKYIRKSFDLRCVVSERQLTVTFYYSGPEFNPLMDFEDRAYDSIESGGKGMLALRIFNHYSFSPYHSYMQGVNIVSMKKEL